MIIAITSNPLVYCVLYDKMRCTMNIKHWAKFLAHIKRSDVPCCWYYVCLFLLLVCCHRLDSLEADPEPEFGCKMFHRDQCLWRERGENRAGQRKRLTFEAGLIKLQSIRRQALEGILPIRSSTMSHNGTQPLYPCLPQSPEVGCSSKGTWPQVTLCSWKQAWRSWWLPQPDSQPTLEGEAEPCCSVSTKCRLDPFLHGHSASYFSRIPVASPRRGWLEEGSVWGELWSVLLQLASELQWVLICLLYYPV